MRHRLPEPPAAPTLATIGKNGTSRGNLGAVVVRRQSSPRAVLAVASLGAVLAFVDATIVNVAFPDIREDFPNSDLSAISWVLNAYNIVFAAFLVAAGRLADLLGRKRLFEGGIVLFTLASVLCAVAPSVETLVLFRIVQAIGAAVVVPASLALVLQAHEGGGALRVSRCGAPPPRWPRGSAPRWEASWSNSTAGVWPSW